MQGAEGGKSCLALPVPTAAPSTHLLAVLLLRHGLHCLNRPRHEVYQVLIEQLSGHLSAVGFGKDRVDTVLSTGTAPGLQGKVQMSQSVERTQSTLLCYPLRTEPPPPSPPTLPRDVLPGAGLIPKELPAGNATVPMSHPRGFGGC